MFLGAKAFHSDLSKWNVSRVTNMDAMFFNAKSFKQKMCGATWVHSEASKKLMFAGTPGSISSTVCTSASPPITTQVTHHHETRPERELIVRTPITTPVGTSSFMPATLSTAICPKCGTFVRSGRVSCCAPGGAWYKNCGGAGNRNVDHSWLAGVETCKRKS